MNASLVQVYAVLASTPERWRQIVTAYHLDLLSREPTTGEWSALHCLQHLLDTELTLFPVRLHAFLAGRDLIHFDPNAGLSTYTEMTPEQLVTAFSAERQKSLTLLTQITDTDLQRTAQHPKFGTATMSELLHTWAGHDLMHTVQAERAMMQPFMYAAGGWRLFFQDHEIKATI